MADERLLRMQRKAARLAQLGLIEPSSLMKINALSIAQPEQEQQLRQSRNDGFPVTGKNPREVSRNFNLSRSPGKRSGLSINAVRKIETRAKRLSLIEIKNIRKVAS